MNHFETLVRNDNNRNYYASKSIDLTKIRKLQDQSVISLKFKWKPLLWKGILQTEIPLLFMSLFAMHEYFLEKLIYKALPSTCWTDVINATLIPQTVTILLYSGNVCVNTLPLCSLLGSLFRKIHCITASTR